MRSSAIVQYRAALLLLYLMSVAASFYFCWVKLGALGYHTRDFPFYLQFAAKVFDPALADIYSINPYGYNFLGLDGIEGMSGLYQTIHLEPLKLLYGLLFGLFGTPLPIFLLFALVYFGPALYLGWHLDPNGPFNRYFAISVGLLVLLFPSSILAVADDLRPYTLLAPLLALTVLSIHFKAARWQSVIFFVAMLSCREEGLIFGIFVIGYALLRAGSQAESKAISRLYGAIWLLWIGGTGIYYVWTGYPLNPFLNPAASIMQELTLPIVLGLWIGLSLLFAAFVILWCKLSDQSHQWLSDQRWLQIGAFILIFIPLFRQVSVSKGRKFERMEFGDALFSVFKDFMLFPKFTLIFVMVMVLLALIWTAIQSRRARQLICAILTILVVTCIYLQAVTWMKTPQVWLERYQRQIADAQLVWDLRMQTDQYQASILSDLNTYQAFADYENIIVYERLPWAIEPSEGRHYPANANRTAELLQNEIDYAVISKDEESIAAINQLFQLAGIQPISSTENDRYQIFQVR